MAIDLRWLLDEVEEILNEVAKQIQHLREVEAVFLRRSR